ncbi:MAG: hypothetical protein Q9183_004979, partial [Haloplaca sp. 2 TL-2023]
MATPTRPQAGRKFSRVPGGFDTDEDLSPIKTEFDHEDLDALEQESPSKSRRVASGHQQYEDESSLHDTSEDHSSHYAGEGNTADEREIRRKLMDLDSSFVPDMSSTSEAANPGADDTYVFGGVRSRPESPTNQPGPDDDRSFEEEQESPATPSELYKTPAPRREERAQGPNSAETDEPNQFNTSSLETMSSSPTAAAAARTVSRAVSMASTKSYATADDTGDSGVPLNYEGEGITSDHDVTPRKATTDRTTSSRDNSPTPTKPATKQEDESAQQDDQ